MYHPFLIVTQMLSHLSMFFILLKIFKVNPRNHVNTRPYESQEKAKWGFFVFCFLFFFVFLVRVFFLFLVFQDRVCLCSLGCPGICSVDQAGLVHTDPPTSASWMLGLKSCTINLIRSIFHWLKKSQLEAYFMTG